MHYYCTRCFHKLSIFNTFQDYRFHMEYEHGLWYLAQKNDQEGNLERSNLIEPPSIANVNIKNKTEDILSTKLQRNFFTEHDKNLSVNHQHLSTRDPVGPSEMTSIIPSANATKKFQNSASELQNEPSLTTDILQKLIEKEQKIDELQHHLQTSSNIQTQMGAELQALRSYMSANNESLAQLKETVNDKNKELVESKILHDTRISEMNRKCDYLQIQIKEMKNHVTIAEVENEALRSKSGSLLISKNIVCEKCKREISVLDHFSQRYGLEQPSNQNLPAQDGVHNFDEHLYQDDQDGKTILLLVFQYLDIESLITCAQVCQMWRECSKNPELWKDITLEHMPILNDFFLFIAPYCSLTESIKLKQLPVPEKRSDETATKYWKRTRGRLEMGLEVLLNASRYTLRKFMVIDCGINLTNRCVWLASCFCRKLDSLVYVSDADPVTPEVLWSLGYGCRNLQTLIVPPLQPSLNPENFTNHSLYVISEAFSNLKVLCIGGSEIDVRGLSSIAKHCEQLQELELDHMGEMREKTAVTICHYGLKGLRIFAFTFTRVTPKALLHIYRSCPNLTAIRICLDFACYFPSGNYSLSKCKQMYQDNVDHLRMLKVRTRLSSVLQIDTEHLE